MKSLRERARYRPRWHLTADQLIHSIQLLETRLVDRRARLAAIEQKLAAAEVAVRRVKVRGRNQYFRRGELVRFCLEALLQAKEPLATHEIIRAALRSKGLDDADDNAVKALARPAREALNTAAKKGIVRSGIRASHYVRWHFVAAVKCMKSDVIVMPGRGKSIG